MLPLPVRSQLAPLRSNYASSSFYQPPDQGTIQYASGGSTASWSQPLTNALQVSFAGNAGTANLPEQQHEHHPMDVGR